MVRERDDDKNKLNEFNSDLKGNNGKRRRSVSAYNNQGIDQFQGNGQIQGNSNEKAGLRSQGNGNGNQNGNGNMNGNERDKVGLKYSMSSPVRSMPQGSKKNEEQAVSPFQRQRSRSAFTHREEGKNLNLYQAQIQQIRSPSQGHIQGQSQGQYHGNGNGQGQGGGQWRGGVSVFESLNDGSPSPQGKKSLKIIGLRERQEIKLSAPELCRRSSDSSPTRFDQRLPERVPVSDPNNTSTQSLKRQEKQDKQEKLDKKIVQKMESTSPNLKKNINSASEERKERNQDDIGSETISQLQLQQPDLHLSYPDFSIFKSSRERLALQANKEKNVQLKFSNAFGTTFRTPTYIRNREPIVSEKDKDKAKSFQF